ncbi:MAG: hypothetical protein QM811_21655 [Pirellulales bacterium]
MTSTFCTTPGTGVPISMFSVCDSIMPEPATVARNSVFGGSIGGLVFSMTGRVAIT